MWYTNKNDHIIAKKKHKGRELNSSNVNNIQIQIQSILFECGAQTTASTKQRIENATFHHQLNCVRASKNCVYIFIQILYDEMSEWNKITSLPRIFCCFSHLIFLLCLWSTTSLLIDQCLTFIQVQNVNSEHSEQMTNTARKRME